MSLLVTAETRSSDIDRLLARIAEVIGPVRCDLWFGEPGRVVIREEEVAFLFESNFESNRVQRSYGPVLRRSVDSILSQGYRISYEQLSPPSAVGPPAPRRNLLRVLRAKEPPGVTTSNPSVKSNARPPSSNPVRNSSARTLERFWFGSENELVQASINQTLQQPGSFSPLLIYGPTGSGKTHLLEGVCSVFRSKLKMHRCVYLTAEEFTNAFVSALRGSGLPMFRKKFRDLDLLALDDIQFLVGKRATITELQYTIDQLGRAGKQIIVTADRSPCELGQLSSELAARISGGLNCPIRYPGLIGRQQILGWMCEHRGWQADPEVLQAIAEGVQKDCRRLSGALNRMRAIQVTSGKPPTVDSIHRDLADLLSNRDQNTTLVRIEQAVCEACGVPAVEMRSSSRTKRISSARMLAMWLSRQYTSSALSEIGDFFGGRSHSTVVAAQKRINDWMKTDEQIEIENASYSVRDAVQLISRRLRVG